MAGLVVSQQQFRVGRNRRRRFRHHHASVISTFGGICCAGSALRIAPYGRTAVIATYGRAPYGRYGLRRTAVIAPYGRHCDVRSYGLRRTAVVGEPAKSGKRGPTPKLQQQMERIAQLPRARQQFVMQVIESVLAQRA